MMCSIALSSGRVVTLELKEDIIATTMPMAEDNTITPKELFEVIFNLKGLVNGNTFYYRSGMI